jgi:hypothetical protein
MTVFRVLLVVGFVAAGLLNGDGLSPVALGCGVAFAFLDKLLIGDDKGCAMWVPSLLIAVALGLVALRMGGAL